MLYQHQQTTIVEGVHDWLGRPVKEKLQQPKDNIFTDFSSNQLESAYPPLFLKQLYGLDIKEKAEVFPSYENLCRLETGARSM